MAIPLRVENTEYTDLSDPANEGYLERNLVQLPSRTWVENGDGIKESEVRLNYDDPAYFDGDAGGSVPNYWPGAGTERANVSHVIRWIAGETGSETVSGDNRTVNKFGRVIQYEDPVGQTTKWEFGDSGDWAAYCGAFVTAVTKYPGNGVELRTEYEYDPDLGQMTLITDPNEAQSTFAYDEPLRRLTEAVEPVEPNGRTIQLAYDDLLRRVTVTADWDAQSSDRQITKRYFDGLGRLIGEGKKTDTEPQWRWTARAYDAKGRVEGVASPISGASDTDELVNCTFPHWTISSFDSLDRVTRLTNPDGTHRDTVYDLFAVATSTPTIGEQILDENGRWKTYARDAAGRITTVIEEDPGTTADGPITTYVYNASGKLTGVHQDNQARTFTYDGLGNLVAAQYPEIEFVKTWDYYLNGQLWKEYVNAEQTGWIEYAYDGVGRVVQKIHNPEDDSEPSHCYVYRYDGVIEHVPYGVPYSPGPNQIGRLTGKWEGDSEYPYVWAEYYNYDLRGRVSAKYACTFSQEAKGTEYYASSYEYNLSGGLQSITYPSGKRATFVLNLENQPRAAGDEFSPTAFATDVSYYLTGAVNTVTVPYGTEKELTSLVYQRTYDPVMQRLSGITLDKLPSTPLMDLGYGYTANGNIDVINYNNGGLGGVSSEDYTYDNLNRLTGVSYPGLGGIQYGYDRFGNMLSRSVSGLTDQTDANPFDFTPHGSTVALTNRLPEAAGFTYDSRGNLITVVHADTGDVESFEYDIENRMIHYVREWTDPDSGDPMETVGFYQYNDGFERIWRNATDSLQVYPNTWSQVNTTYLYAPGGELLTELSYQTGGEYVPAASNPVQQDSFSGESVKYQFTDHLGTTRFMAGMTWMYDTYNPEGLDYSVQAVESPELVTPFGAMLYPAGSGINPDFLLTADPVLFTGKPRDIESGLDIFGPRNFSFNLCRWMSPDLPLIDNQPEDPQSWNLFNYVRSNPVNFTDPTGYLLKTDEIDRIKEIVGSDDAGYIVDNDGDGYIDEFNVDQDALDSNEGLSLIHDLVSDQEFTYGYDENSLFAKGVDNLDILEDWRSQLHGEKTADEMPPPGIDDQVSINPNAEYVDLATKSQTVSTAALAFHELAEAYSKFREYKPYAYDPRIQGNKGRPGAHAIAIFREMRWLTQRPGITQYPGGAWLHRRK